METVALSKIVPDVEQPRRYFNAEKLHSLKESIKKHGIISPLVVEDMGSGKFLLVDGERRFRAATELKLKEVPVIIEKPTTAVERLVKQFNVQEQHEAWTPLEKAEALIKLSKEMGQSLQAICKLLNITNSTTRKYISFSELANKEAYLKSEVPLDYADQFKWVKTKVIALKEQAEEEFTINDQKKLEARLIANIKDGVISRRSDITKLKDAFSKAPKLIDEYIAKSDATPLSMFKKAGGQGAYYLRNAVNNIRYFVNHAHRFMEKKDVKISNEQLAHLKQAKKALDAMIGTVS